MLSPCEVILFTIYCSNGVVYGITRLQKILFLLQRETGLGDFIFKPYRFGPFSMEIKEIVQSLENQGFLKVEEGVGFSPLQEHPVKIIYLTSQGLCEAEKIMEKLDENTLFKAQIIIRYFNRVPLTYLIAYIYAKYPEYTTLSEIKEISREWREFYELRSRISLR